jgi:predicted DNA-binding WGR domain protein
MNEAQKQMLGRVERYENTEDGHSKFWELTVIQQGHGLALEAGWGKIGKAPQGTKVYSLEEADKLIREKTAKGYEKV